MPRDSENKVKSLLKVIALALCSLFVISGFYQLIKSTPINIPSPYQFFFANTCLAIVGLFVLSKAKIDFGRVSDKGFALEQWVSKKLLLKLRKFPYLPGAVMLAGIIFLCGISNLFGGSVSSSSPVNLYLLVSITLVPLVEEVLFRGVLTPLLCKLSSSSWAGYFSAIVFSILHTANLPQDIAAGNFGIALGPLILGLICETFMRLKLGIVSAICFHVAANASILVFSLLDKRWLDWLSMFYL
jgi:membrane protease YdiL (CAAX protease family)